MTTEPRPTAEPRSRRAILAGALTGLAGLIAGRATGPDATRAAAGQNLVLGSLTNDAGTASTKLTTSTGSSGTALYVLQNGTGTALRGVANNGIAGFFTSANGTGISGVTAKNNQFGVYGANDAASNGGGEAIRANGQQNHGLVATTANATANAVVATSTVADGIAILATNSNTGLASSAGSGIRALSFGATVADIHPGDLYDDAAGEFAGAIGVIGAATTPIGTSGIGVLGLGNSGYAGVMGVASSGYGVSGTSTSGAGIYGSSASFEGVNGVSLTSIGVLGQSTSGNGVQGSSITGYAGYFSGNVNITGTITKGAGTFTIDHPLDPAHKTLAHSFVESPDMMNVYNGNVTTDAKGEATVTLPAYFEALNRDFRYQLTVLGYWTEAWISAEVKDNTFGITTTAPRSRVSWQVTGIRRDAYANAHRIVVEAAKSKRQDGLYLYPKEHGQPESKGVDYAPRQALLPKLAQPKK